MNAHEKRSVIYVKDQKLKYLDVLTNLTICNNNLAANISNVCYTCLTHLASPNLSIIAIVVLSLFSPVDCSSNGCFKQSLGSSCNHTLMKCVHLVALQLGFSIIRLFISAKFWQNPASIHGEEKNSAKTAHSGNWTQDFLIIMPMLYCIANLNGLYEVMFYWF